MYAVGGFFIQDTASAKGPLIADTLQIKNSGLVAGWAPFNNITGLPGTTSTTLELVAESWSG